VKENPSNTNRNIELAGVAVIAVFALVVIATVYATMPLFDPVYLLGPGLFPFALGAMLLVACGVLFSEIRRGKHDLADMRALFDKAALKRPLALMGLLGITLLLIPLLGFSICLFFFSFVEMTWLEMEKRKWWINAIYAACVTGGVYYLFEALTMTLPQPFWL
jgi:hypothetical protein